MDIGDTSAVIEFLNKTAGGSETWRVEKFTMERKSSVHGYQTVDIQILDRGPDISPRYIISAETADGQSCSGNSGDDLAQVIAAVHWFELDK